MNGTSIATREQKAALGDSHSCTGNGWIFKQVLDNAVVINNSSTARRQGTNDGLLAGNAKVVCRDRTGVLKAAAARGWEVA